MSTPSTTRGGVPASPASATAAARLAAVRQLLAERKLDAYIVPTADAHQSEYVADCDKRREWVSTFTGSAGTAVITPSKALLWTDGRYFLQASQELSPDWTLMKAGTEGVPTVEAWLGEQLPRSARVGVDAQITPIGQFKRLNTAFASKAVELVSSETKNLVDLAWSERPSIPSAPLIILPIDYTGESIFSKVTKLRAELKKADACALVVSALDEVCWLFNLRGGDIPFNPVFMSYALVTLDTVTLYINPAKITAAVKEHLGELVTIRDYGAIFDDLQAISARLQAADTDSSAAAETPASAAPAAADSKDASASVSSDDTVKPVELTGRVWMDVNKCNLALYQAVSSDYVLEKDSPIALMKGIKNAVELEGMRQAHLRDAVAMCKYLHWLEGEMERKVAHTEVTVADRLEAFRAELKDFVGLSFDTISAAGPNGAIIHYHPLAKSARAVTASEMYLCDSGGQYRDGTTDVTRTVHMGTPTAFERMTFTRVLQGHIGLAAVTFPAGTVGPTLDLLARRPLWQHGLDYGHGTGHGVGAFLNVHEGPHGISSTIRQGSQMTTALQPGMVVTNEPGYYHEGAFGIRIESVLVVVKRDTEHKFNGKQFLGFDNITLVPIQRSLVDASLLTRDELAYLNAYHAKVRAQVTPLLADDAPVAKWLHEATEPIVAA